MNTPLLRCVTLALLSSMAIGSAWAQTTSRESVSTTGQPGNDDSVTPSLSFDGRYVAFASIATNLTTGDANGRQDIFWRDRQAGTTLLMSATSGGAQANQPCTNPAISGDGRWVAFLTLATTLASGDNNNSPDIFVADSQSLGAVRVSVSSQGNQGNGYCRYPAISFDGRFVAFSSDSTNLVTGDTNNFSDVFVHDMQTGATFRVSTDSFGSQSDSSSGQYGIAISADGNLVAFSSEAHLATGGGTDTWTDIFVHDVAGGSTTQASVSSGGTPGNNYSRFPSISSDGRFVAFVSAADNLVFNDTNGRDDVFVHDNQTGETIRCSVDSMGNEANGTSNHPGISPDGRVIAFDSVATNLVAGDTNGASDVFTFDSVARVTQLVSVDTAGTHGNGASANPSVGFFGRQVAFDSASDNIVIPDSNASPDIFVREPQVVVLSGLSPPSGTLAGNEFVRLRGVDFTSLSDTTVTFGGIGASISSITSTLITVRTPPGASLGPVDVQVQNSNGIGSLPGAYTYVEPRLAARYGHVNTGVGDRQDVLLVNVSPGDPVNREVVAQTRRPISLVMTNPASRQSARYVVYAWLANPDNTTLTPLPRGLGAMMCPPPFVHQLPTPTAIFNNLGHARVLGNNTAPLPPPLAPATIGSAPRGSRRPLIASFQGIIQDDGSEIPERFSVTNGVVLRIQ
ncbi:MAG: PD40 domain-containing protein [Planctomycetes bacterium]|nr:PD40 domain-containing protein [Planctomycetota bacterium]MBI3845936.1 PD40 domain-containing protein [Planctomycetota bacterium]